MERTTWTDERLDERMRSIEQTNERIFSEFDRVHAELAALRSDFNRFQDRMVQIAFAFVGVLLAQVVALTIALA